MTALPLLLLDIVEHLNRVAHHELRRRNLTSLRVHTASPLFEPTSSPNREPTGNPGVVDLANERRRVNEKTISSST